MEWNTLNDLISEYDVITIFRHENPDCDAVGSQFGLKYFIMDNYPKKKVYALGDEDCYQGYWPDHDQADEKIIEKSLAIVLDTANESRVDDQRFLKASKIVKIDHHPNHEPFGDLMLVDSHAAACCEILADYCKSREDCKLTSATAQLLYCGILTDTLNYSTSNTTANTLRAGAYLAEHGIDIPAIGRRLFDKTLAEFHFTSFIRSNVQVIDDKVAYTVVTEDALKQYKITSSKARSNVDEIGHVKDFKIWCVFTEKHAEGLLLYDASLRSKEVKINSIAEKYHGGGHKNACGVKNLTKEKMKELLKDLADSVK